MCVHSKQKQMSITLQAYSCWIDIDCIGPWKKDCEAEKFEKPANPRRYKTHDQPLDSLCFMDSSRQVNYLFLIPAVVVYSQAK